MDRLVAKLELVKQLVNETQKLIQWSFGKGLDQKPFRGREKKNLSGWEKKCLSR